jgi:hypothetical protein
MLEQLPDSEFALICHGPQGDVHRMLPMATTPLAKYSEGLLIGLHDVLPSTMRAGVASALKDKLLRLGQKPHWSLEKISSNALARRTWTWDTNWDTSWQVQDALLRQTYKKTSSSSSSSTDWRNTYDVEVPANPLLVDGHGGNIQLRSSKDASQARDWLSRHGTKVSSLVRHTVASGILDAYSSFGIDPYTSSYAKKYLGELHKFSRATNHPRSMIAPLLEDRIEQLERRKLSAAQFPAGEEMIQAYEALIEDVDTFDNLGWSKEKALDFATKISHLDEALGMNDHVLSSFDVFFPSCMTKVAQASPVVYVQNATIVRQNDLEKFELMNLGAVEKILGQKVADGLKTDPLKTFNSLNDAKKRWLTNYINDHIKVPKATMVANYV